MSEYSIQNKRIAKNTIFLYIRKVINLILTFLTSRYLLEALGVNDFGLYGLVGSIVTLFSSLKGLFTSSIQRFVNTSKGKDDINEINKIFNLGIRINLWISLIFIVCVEIAGVLMIPKLNILPDMIVPAQWLLQCSILTAVVTIMTTPYDAIIISNEKFDFYALVSVIETILKFGIVFLLFLNLKMKIVWYGLFLLGVALIIRLINYIYCKKHYRGEIQIRKVKDKELMKKMSSFAGWNFLGNTGYALQTSGVNFILNIFGGTIANAARTIAYQVMTGVTQFTSDINVSFIPRIMKEYSKENYTRFQSLLFFSSKTTFSICIIVSFPIFFLTPQILKIWLIEVPEYSIIFVRWILIYISVRSLHTLFDVFFKSVGEIKWYQIFDSFFLSSVLLITWILLKYFKYELWIVFPVMIIMEICDLIVSGYIAYIKYDFNLKKYGSEILFPFLITLILFSIIFYFTKSLIVDNISLISTFLIFFIILILTFISTILINYKKSEIIKIFDIFVK